MAETDPFLLVPRGPRGPPRRSCAACSAIKIKCSFGSRPDSDHSAPCDRCARLGRACLPQDDVLSRRKREKLKKITQASSAGPGTAYASPVAAYHGGQAGPGVGWTVTEPPGDQRANLGLADPALALVPHHHHNPHQQQQQTLPGSNEPSTTSLYSNYSSGVLSGSSTDALSGLAVAASSTASWPQQPVSYPGPALFQPPWAAENAGPSSITSSMVLNPLKGVAPPDLPDILGPSVLAYWLCVQPLRPLLHRSTFQRAFNKGTPNPVYGTNQPHALLYALAALGTRHALVPGLSEADRTKCGNYYCEKSRELLLAGYFNPAPGAGPIGHIEALQAMTLIFTYCVPGGMTPTLLPLLQTRVDTILKLFVDPRLPGGGNLLVPSTEPVDASDWLLREIRARLWIGTLVADISTSYQSARPLLYDWFRQPFTLPCHEHFFDMESPEQAFHLLYRDPAQPRRPPVVIDFTALASPDIAPAARSAIVASVFQPALHYSASYSCIVVFNLFVGMLRARLAMYATSSSVDPLVVGSKEPIYDSPTERTYRTMAQHIENLVDDFFAVLPADIGQGLDRGDPSPFFKNWNRYFSDLSYAHAFFTGYVMARSARMDIWGDPTKASNPDVMLSTPRYYNHLKAASVVVKLIEGQINDDPSLRWSHNAGFGSMLKIGYLFLAAIRHGKGNQGRFEREVKVVARALNQIGRTVQSAPKELARGFEVAMRAAGIMPLDASPPADSLD